MRSLISVHGNPHRVVHDNNQKKKWNIKTDFDGERKTQKNVMLIVHCAV